MTPKRIQRQRTKGWRMPEGAVYVGRPTVFGNPYRAGRDGAVYEVASYREALTNALDRPWGQPVDLEFRIMAERLPELRGHDLACWCPPACGHEVGLYGVIGDLYEPCRKPAGHGGWHDPSVTCCHADVLLELANR